MKSLTALLICCLLPLLGCKKDALDYRNKYLGDYLFTVQYSIWILGGQSYDTTYTCNGKIDYGTKNNSVLITISENHFEFTLYEEGTLESLGQYYSSNMGEFESDSKVIFDFTRGGHGGGDSFFVKGEKQ